MTAPQPIVDLYRRAQVDEDMDCGTYFGGTDRYGMSSIIEGIAELAGWTLPDRMRRAEREQFLVDADTPYLTDLLGASGRE